MSDEKQNIKQALREYYVSRSLSDTQLGGLQQTLKQQRQAEAGSYSDAGMTGVAKWMGSLVASLLLFVLITAYLQPPALVTLAYADIRKDAGLNNGMQSSMQQWLDENGIARVPLQYPVEMSKFCRLDQILTTHLRIAGTEQGEMNVFFHRGERSLFWLDRSGTVDDMAWKLLKVRENLTLIVLYSHDMRERSVQYILDDMLRASSETLSRYSSLDRSIDMSDVQKS
ncbi:MAG TPA: hypothetical protein ENJ87_10965 [Gammaproteobacteria bacterium]|nr:hypothetical protein [Gammaproteobacteria bacterium]